MPNYYIIRIIGIYLYINLDKIIAKKLNSQLKGGDMYTHWQGIAQVFVQVSIILIVLTSDIMSTHNCRSMLENLPKLLIKVDGVYQPCFLPVCH